MQKTFVSASLSPEILRHLENWWFNKAIPAELRHSDAFFNVLSIENKHCVGASLAGHTLLYDNIFADFSDASEEKKEKESTEYARYLVHSSDFCFTDEEKEEVAQDLNKLLAACEKDKALTQAVEDAFLAPLQFGTAGLRGIMGAGLNRMNVYTIATASAGIAQWLLNTYGEEACRTRGVVMGYDTRHHSAHFALVGSLVLAAHGIHVHLYPQYCATPLLAYAIKPLTALAGLMVTASHNPKAYNGYKIYGEDGIQIGSEEANAIASAIHEHYSMISLEEALEKGLLHKVSSIIERDYLEDVRSLLRPSTESKNIQLVYTAMHGTGAKYVLPLLESMQFEKVALVSEQIQPDGDFPTAPAPNPEFEKALAYTFKKCEEVQADLALATDPDADRLSILIKTKNAEKPYRMLTGNQIGSLLTYAFLSAQKEKNALSSKSAMVKSIVTDHLGAAIAESFGVHAEESLTGFKSICGKIREFEEKGTHTFLFGYEESIGYAFNPYVLDKDGISAALLLASAAAFYKEQGLSLDDVLESIYQKHGYHVAYTENLVREGKKGMHFMSYIMENYRKVFPKQYCTETNCFELFRVEDFKDGSASIFKKDGATEYNESYTFAFERSNVLRFTFQGGAWYALRPSGTEPKLKIYFHAQGNDEASALKNLQALQKTVMEKIQALETAFLADWKE